MNAGDGDPFLTLSSPAEAELRVRSSRFVAYAFPTDTEEAAKEVLRERERLHFDARHHCAAWRLRSGIWRAHDAGEPAGSAGAPILAAIDAQGLSDTAVVVSRYFGGTKLGIGGLARAYAAAAAAALSLAAVCKAIPAARLEIRYPFAFSSVVMRSLERHGGRAIEHLAILSNDRPVLRASVPLGARDGLAGHLRDMSAGTVDVETIGRTLLREPSSA